ncbi:LysR family transcriptional regulator [Pseudomonas aeruginosa]|uniref:LysR family transcriptional regulator n=1 Tax=Pseudomonas aeruginosa TaxID=287 RepID=UPI001068872C|nr:LysR family transcriptional regulator [Pseudomonas aeruginosa]TER11155.1 LysR family transcriptional regulator [Pseudomonas aeruginosa]
MNFSSDTIELFLAVLDRGSFSGAARALGRVPSAVSMGIANLEAELGFALFERTHREARPTALARALAPQARMIAEQLAQLQVHALELSQGLESRLSLGVVADIDSGRLFGALRTLSELYPLLDVEVLSAAQDDALALLHGGRISLCFGFAGISVNPQERFQYVGAESLVATISPRHPALQKPGQALYLEELVNVRQILVASCDLPLADTRPLIAGACWRTDSLGTALEMVEAGIGWGNFPLSRVAPLLATGRLVRLDFRNTKNELKLPVHAIWLKNQPLRKAAQELVGMLATRPD